MPSLDSFIVVYIMPSFLHSVNTATISIPACESIFLNNYIKEYSETISRHIDRIPVVMGHMLWVYTTCTEEHFAKLCSILMHCMQTVVSLACRSPVWFVFQYRHFLIKARYIYKYTKHQSII